MANELVCEPRQGDFVMDFLSFSRLNCHYRCFQSSVLYNMVVLHGKVELWKNDTWILYLLSEEIIFNVYEK